MRFAFLQDGAGKVTGPVLNPRPWLVSGPSDRDRRKMRRSALGPQAVMKVARRQLRLSTAAEIGQHVSASLR